MKLLQRRACGPSDEGSILLALFAMMIVSGLLTVGLATIVNAHSLARHDTAFESALAGAEEGLNELVAQVKATPTSTSFAPVTGTTAAGVAYRATASASGNTWLVDATGTATSSAGSVTRHIQATVTLRNLLDDSQGYALFGEKGVNLAHPSAIDRYDSATSSDVCATSGSQTTMTNPDSRMCHSATPRFGNVATDGTLTLTSQDLPYINEGDIYNAPVSGSGNPDSIGKCGGDTCSASSSQVKYHTGQLLYPTSTLCANGIGGGATAYDGSTVLSANTVYSFSDVTLNATAIADLNNVANSRLVICFNGRLKLPPLVPLNSTTSPTNVLDLDPRPPSTLLLVDTKRSGSTPVVDFGGGLSGETAISAVIYAPDATCSAGGHVDVYGVLICQSVAAPNGLDVHYDTELGSFGSSTFDRSVTVSDWHEITN